MVWTHGREALDEFIDYLNNCHPTIKFTTEISETEISFLDTTVHLDKDGSLWTDLHCKPTDSHGYLHFTSAHPSHCKWSLPYSQFLTVRRICSKQSDFVKHALMLVGHFKRRGYPDHIISRSLVKASCQYRIDLLAQKPNASTLGDDQKIHIITTFSPEFLGLKPIIWDNWDLLKRSQATKLLAETKLVFGHRRPKNLRDFLVRAKLPQIKEGHDKIPCSKYKNKCKHINCKYCSPIDTMGRIISTYTKREYTTRSNVTCQSNNLIYCITCKKCKK